MPSQFTDSVSFPQNRGKLESLPPELLLVLFDWLRIISNAQKIPHITHPLSRSLVTYIRQNLYRDVKISSNAFHDFCDTIKLHNLYSNIVSLKVVAGMERLAEIDAIAFELFSRADQLQSLDTGFDYSLAFRLLSPRFAGVCLPHLTSLKITAPKDIDLSQLLRYRRRYRTLEKLQIFVVGMAGDGVARREARAWMEEEYPENGEEGLPLDRIATLVIDNDFAMPSWTYLTSFTSLHTLNITIADPQQKWVSLFRSVSSPLLHFTLSNPQIPVDIASILPIRFPTLTTLSIRTIEFPQIFFRYLPHARHLSTLSLNGRIEPDHLTAVLTGSPRMPSLRKLIALEWEGESARGLVAGDAGHQYVRNVGGFGPATGWEPPQWSELWPRSKVEYFLQLAKTAGIDVGTHLQDAMRVEDEYQVERDRASEYSMTEEGFRRMELEEQPEIEVMQYADIDWGF